MTEIFIKMTYPGYVCSGQAATVIFIALSFYIKVFHTVN